MFGDSEVSTTFAAANTGVAQLVEHRSPKPGVGSSSLSSRAKIKKVYSKNTFFFYVKITSTSLAPCAPITNACSISAVLDGPEINTPNLYCSFFSCP